MSDLISRKEAIDIVDELFTHGDCYCDRFSVVGALRGLPSAEPECKWIPVTEALPKKYIDVLLQFPHTMAVGYHEDGYWSIITCDGFYSGLDEADAKPIAWMPLPEPYRGRR